MISLEPSFAIRAIVDAALPGYDEHKGVYVGFEMRVSDPESFDPIGSGTLHCIFQKRTNYITVWTLTQYDEILSGLWKTKAEEYGPHKCHHDDCWVESVNSELFEMYINLCRSDPQKRVPNSLYTTTFTNKVQHVQLEVRSGKAPKYRQNRYYITSIYKEGK